MKRFLLFLIIAFSVSGIIMIPFAGSIGGLGSFLTTANPLLAVALWALGFAICSYIFSLATGDYSWVDRLWSTLPVGFVWYYAFRGGFTPALKVASGILTLWGLRLSLNFARKGGYSGVEDYRWNILRGRIQNPVQWQLFSLLFIAFYQLALFVLFTYPVYSIARYAEGAPSPLFWAAAALTLGFISLETAADQQQWKFHAAKRRAAEGRDYPRQYAGDVQAGFLSHGLFAFSRHPNYCGELGTWWSVWLMALSLIGAPLRAGVIGPLALTLLFISSAKFTESLTSAKYPRYKDYQTQVSPIIPWFPRKPRGDQLAGQRIPEGK